MSSHHQGSWLKVSDIQGGCIGPLFGGRTRGRRGHDCGGGGGGGGGGIMPPTVCEPTKT
jgi:hypothetical protein